MSDTIEFKSYEVLKNNHCLNRWIKYFYECELFKCQLRSHRLDPKKDRYELSDPYDIALFEEKRKILYAKFVQGLVNEYGTRKTMLMKRKVLKLNMKMLKAMYLLAQNKKIYRYAQKFANHSGFKREVFDVNTDD